MRSGLRTFAAVPEMESNLVEVMSEVLGGGEVGGGRLGFCEVRYRHLRRFLMDFLNGFICSHGFLLSWVVGVL